jgi:chemotaxis regulatin CheY-phosphate phosphatase CheZ
VLQATVVLCKHSLQAESNDTGQMNDAIAAILVRLAVQHLTGHVISSVVKSVTASALLTSQQKHRYSALAQRLQGRHLQ